MSPKPSAASRPEFFVDRSLGRSTTALPRQLGWIVHLVNDHFEYDAQFVKDADWIEYGLQRGWALLTKDQKIRYRAGELLSLDAHGKMFCLGRGDLTVEDQARTFDEARARIERTSSGPYADTRHASTRSMKAVASRSDGHDRPRVAANSHLAIDALRKLNPLATLDAPQVTTGRPVPTASRRSAQARTDRPCTAAGRAVRRPGDTTAPPR